MSRYHGKCNKSETSAGVCSWHRFTVRIVSAVMLADLCSRCSGERSHRAIICLSAHASVCLSVCHCLIWSFGARFSPLLWLSCSDTCSVLRRRTGQNLEEKVVHPHRQLSLLLRVHHSECCLGCHGNQATPPALSLCFVFAQDKEPRGIIPLENLSVKEVEDKKPVSEAPSAGESVNCQPGDTFSSSV